MKTKFDTNTIATTTVKTTDVGSTFIDAVESNCLDNLLLTLVTRYREEFDDLAECERQLLLEAMLLGYEASVYTDDVNFKRPLEEAEQAIRAILRAVKLGFTVSRTDSSVQFLLINCPFAGLDIAEHRLLARSALRQLIRSALQQFGDAIAFRVELNPTKQRGFICLSSIK